MRYLPHTILCVALVACSDDSTPTPDASDIAADTIGTNDAADGADADPCGGCPSGATCDSSGDEPVCTCAEGFIGDGTACAAPVVVSRFEVLPQPMRRGEPARVAFDATGATGCTLSIDAWSMSLGPADLAAGVVELTLPEAALTAFAESDGRPATLLCQGASAGAVSNEARRTAAVVLAPGLPLVLTASTTALAEGGSVNVCWRAPADTRCELNGMLEILSDQPAEGCADFTFPSSGSVLARCYGEPGHAETTLNIAVGPAIRRFEATPVFVTAGSDTTLVWEAPFATGCRLRVRGVWEDVPTHGERRVAVSRNENFELACDGELAATTSAVELPFVDVQHVAHEARARLNVSYHAWFASTCELSARGGGNTMVRPVDATGGYLVLDVPPLAEGDWQVDIACDGPFGPTAGQGPVPSWVPLPVVDAPTVTPARVPVGGGGVTVCWNEPEADWCALFWDGNGDAEGEGGGVGCATRLVLYPQDGVLVCCQGGRCGSAMFQTRMGAGIESFVVQPSRIEAPGDVSVSWRSLDTERCVLLAGDTVVADATDHDGVTVALAETTELALRCWDGAGFDTRSATVVVGAEVLGFDAFAVQDGVHLRWFGEGLESCDLDVEAGEAGWHFTGLGFDFGDPRHRDGQGDFFLAFDPSVGFTATLTCTAADGTTHTREVSRPPTVPLEITAFDAEPRALATPGMVDLCWSTRGASVCSIDWNDGASFSGARYDLPANGCLSDTAEGVVAVATTTTFAVTCSGPLDLARQELVVSLGPAITRFEATAMTLDTPGDVDVAWDTFALSSCFLTDGQQRIATGTSGTETVALTATTTFTLNCLTSSGATLQQELTVAVGPSILDFAGRPLGVDVIETTHRAVLVDVCRATLSPVSNSAVPIIYEGLPAEGTTTWYFPIGAEGDVRVALECTGPGGTTQASITIAPPPPATLVSFQPSPALPPGGGDVDLCWATTGVEGCWVYAGNYGNQAGASGCLSDLFDTLAVTEHTPAGVSCQGLGGQVERHVIIPVGPYIEFLGVDPAALPEAGEATITWRALNAAGCTLGAGSTLATGLEGMLTRSFSTSTDLTLRCHDGAATAEQVARVTVGPDFMRLGATANGVDSVFVFWAAAFADRCEVERLGADGSIVEAWTDLPVDHNLMAYNVPLTDAEARFVVRCHAGGTNFARTLVVPAVEPVVVTAFRAHPTVLDAPGAFDLCWSATGDVASCIISAPQPNWGKLSRTLPPEGCWSEVIGAPLDLSLTTPFELSCTGLGGGEQARLLVPVGPAVVSFAADPPTLPAAGSTTLRWQTAGATHCELVPPGGAAVNVPAHSGSRVVQVEGPATFTLRCEDVDGRFFEDTLTVALGPTIVDLAVGASSADTVWIDLIRHDLELCHVDLAAVEGPASERVGEWLGLGLVAWDFAAFGDVEVRMTCFSGDIVVHRSAVATSPLPAIASFAATPAALATPGASTLCWQAEHADACILTVAGNERVVPAEGCNHGLSDTFRVFSATTTATLSCDNEHGVTETSATVHVGPAIMRFDASLTSLPPGGFFTTLRWEAAHVGTCALSDGSELLAASTSGDLEVWVGETTTFTLACTAAGGGTGPSADLVVGVP